MSDVWDSAETARPPSTTYFAEVTLDVWYCALIKGQGKVPFDGAQHKAGERRTAIDMTLVPLASRGVDWVIERKLIAESRQWAGTVLPSIRALGISAKELSGKFVRYQMTPTGRTWTGKDGLEKSETVPVFEAVYSSEDECEEAADSFFNAPVEDDEEEATVESGSKEKDTAAKFLPALWAQSKGDLAKFEKLLAGNPLTSKHFDVASPEVLAVIA